ncbi:hypothetical protein JG688_00005830 [Phytophthora aleatoria]|uniref:Uncharacterized protein n=1 Tax=Phytophthora aleatoria TaxID=2496075 RepID=A0A8J5M6A0_9STRA|nr:hypothetical protein JG688_00005830 [Phytophthora aleatoria]
MDASDYRLCCVYPARNEYLQVRFTSTEREQIEEFNRAGDSNYGINVRELTSAVYAAITWGKYWSGSSSAPRYVRYWIDNQSVISWNNRRSSRSPLAQLLLRLLSLLEVQHNCYGSAAHIPGVENIAADAGSRVWQSPAHASQFANLSLSWSQVHVPIDCRDLWRLWERYCAQGPSRTLHELYISVPGVSGASGAQ